MNGELVEFPHQWRMMPPTEEQLEVARKMRIAHEPDVTRGELSDMIAVEMSDHPTRRR